MLILLNDGRVEGSDDIQTETISTADNERF